MEDRAVIEASDSVLVAAARDGDLLAFEQLVRRHQLPIYRVALRMLGSAADAEDVAQETFVQAWRSLTRFREESAFATWLYRIATNRALNVLVARRSMVELDTEQAAALAEPSEIAEQRERLRAVVQALRSLAPEARALLVLRELEDLSYREIAEVLEIPASTVKGRMHRARAELVATLGEAA